MGGRGRQRPPSARPPREGIRLPPPRCRGHAFAAHPRQVGRVRSLCLRGHGGGRLRPGDARRVRSPDLQPLLLPREEFPGHRACHPVGRLRRSARPVAAQSRSPRPGCRDDDASHHRPGGGRVFSAGRGAQRHGGRARAEAVRGVRRRPDSRDLQGEAVDFRAAAPHRAAARSAQHPDQPSVRLHSARDTAVLPGRVRPYHPADGVGRHHARPARRRAGDLPVPNLQPDEPGDEAAVDRRDGCAAADRDRRDLRHELQSHAPHPRSPRLLGRRRQHGYRLAGDRGVAEAPQMALKLAADVLTLKTKHPFVIARGGDDDTRVVWVRLMDGDGMEGWGEADPSRYYGETADTVLATLRRLEPHLPTDPFDLDAAEAKFAQLCPKHGAARAALSAALHDLVGKRLDQPVWRLWGLDPARAPRSSFTIGLDTPDKMRQKVLEASSYPILKIKLGTDRDEAILKTVRDATDKPLRVDANAGWTRERALHMLPVLKEYGVEFVEQPLPPDDLEGLAAVRRRGILPVVVDESCIVAADIPRLSGAADGINIKLAKCGSLREALRMIATARAHGMLVMVGCMIETSLGITAAAHFTPLVDAADLDGAALTANDPFVGATIDGGQIRLPTGPGLGVRRRG